MKYIIIINILIIYNWPGSQGSSTINTKRAKMRMINNLLLHISDLQREPSNKLKSNMLKLGCADHCEKATAGPSTGI